jgi:hypothetical protein
MRAIVQRAGRERPAWLALLFCALLLRAFVPGGYMIGSSAAGSPAFVICPEAAPPAMHSGHHQEAPGKHREAPCPFGLLAAPALPSTPPFVVAAASPLPPLAPSRVQPGFGAALAAPPPPSTGPPVSARS